MGNDEVVGFFTSMWHGKVCYLSSGFPPFPAVGTGHMGCFQIQRGLWREQALSVPVDVMLVLMLVVGRPVCI